MFCPTRPSTGSVLRRYCLDQRSGFSFFIGSGARNAGVASENAVDLSSEGRGRPCGHTEIPEPAGRGSRRIRSSPGTVFSRGRRAPRPRRRGRPPPARPNPGDMQGPAPCASRRFRLHACAMSLDTATRRPVRSDKRDSSDGFRDPDRIQFRIGAPTGCPDRCRVRNPPRRTERPIARLDRTLTSAAAQFSAATALTSRATAARSAPLRTAIGCRRPLGIPPDAVAIAPSAPRVQIA